MIVNLLKNNLKKIFWFRHKRRKNRKRGRKHLQKFFNTRKKKYIYYYKKCVFLKSKTKQSFENNYNLNHTKKKYCLGIKSKNSGIINMRPLKSVKFVSQRFMRSRKLEKYFRHNLSSITPDFFLTAKPKAVRMGKGKGPLKTKIFVVKKGLVLFNIKYCENYKKHNLDRKLFFFKLNIFLFLLLSRLKTKFPFTTTIIQKKL